MREQIGFWSSSNDPRTLVDPGWPLRERVRLATYLRRGEVLNYWLGFSHCRFDCGIPPQCTGTKDLGDECYIWPEGLPHYIEEHAVRLPAEFLAHVEPRLPWLWPWWRLGLWWRRRQVARASARQRQADEDRRDQAQREALHTAAWERDDERVRVLLAEGHAVDGRSEYGLTPLARARSLAVTRLLLDAGAEVDPQPPGAITPLLQAASDDDCERIELLLERGADIRGLDNFGRSVLDYCKPARVEWLLERGADPKLGAPLSAAAGAGDLAAMERLLTAGAELEGKRGHFTPLLIAARDASGDEALLFLLARGADPTVRDDAGFTPLHHAASRGSPVAVRALLEGGGDAAVVSTRGKVTPLHLAAIGVNISEDCHARGDGVAVLELLLAYPAHRALLQARDEFGRTALDCARTYGRPEQIQILEARSRD